MRRNKQRMLWHRHLTKGQERKEDAAMARNEDKYFYLHDVGIEKGSWLLEKFLADLNLNQMTELPSKFAVQRLADYYQLRERLDALQVAQPVTPPVASQSQQISEAPVPSPTPVVGSRRGKKKAETPPAVEQQLSEDDYDDFYGSL